MHGHAQGFVDHERQLVALSALEPNGQVAVLVHEPAHVHGARHVDFGRAGAEVVAETAAHIALSAAHLDTRAQSVLYVSGWADAAPKELAGYADAVYRIAGRLEAALGMAPPRLERSPESAGGDERRIRDVPSLRPDLTRPVPGPTERGTLGR